MNKTTETTGMSFVAILAVLFLTAIPLLSFSYGLHAAYAAPSSFRLNHHTCDTFFQGTWDNKAKSCTSLGDPSHFIILHEGQKLTIPRGLTLIVPTEGVFALQLGSELINKGNMTIMFGAFFENGDGTITNYGTIKNNGLIANHGLIDNFGTINNAGAFIHDVGDIINNFGEINNSSLFANSGFISNTGSFNNTGTLYNFSVFENCGTFSNTGTLIGNPISNCPT